MTNLESHECALCLWEAFLASPESHPDLSALRNEIGTATLRLGFANEQILQACHDGWVELHKDGENFCGPFDWEYCPVFLEQCLTADGCAVVLVDDWRNRLAAAVIAAAEVDSI